MRIFITNAVISNTGDAAILQGIEDSLVRADICKRDEIAVSDSDAKGTSKVYPEKFIYQQLTVSPPRQRPRVRRTLQRARSILGRLIIKWPRLAELVLLKTPLRRTKYGNAFAALCHADAVISTGGTYLVDHYNYADKITELEIARALGKPVYLWTQSMGPFQSHAARSSIQKLDGWLSGLFLRDQRSFDSWQALNSVPTSTAVVPDVAFAMDLALPKRTNFNGHKKRAILSVREWSKGGVDSSEYSQAAYEEGMRSMASHLLSKGWEVIALSTCQGLERYAMDDSKYAAGVFTGLDVGVISTHHTPKQLVDALVKADLVVTTRMHLSILSLMAGISTLAVAYEFKTLELFGSLGLSKSVIKIEDIDESWIRQALEAYEESPESLRVEPEVLAQLREAASSPASQLRVR